MGKAGHDSGNMPLRQIEQRTEQGVLAVNKPVNGVAQIQADVGRDLIVARAPGVQLLARLANQLDETGLDIHVHVFAVGAPVKLARIDFVVNAPQPVANLRNFLRAQHANPAEHIAMCNGGANVLPIQTPIKGNRRGERLDKRIGRLPQSGVLMTGFRIHAVDYSDLAHSSMSASTYPEHLPPPSTQNLAQCGWLRITFPRALPRLRPMRKPRS